MKTWRRVYGPIGLLTPASAGDALYDRAGGMAVKAPSIGADEGGSRQALADGEVDSPGCAWRQRHRHNLASFAQHRQRPVAAVEPEGLDVGANSFRDTEAVQGEERDEGPTMMVRPPFPGVQRSRKAQISQVRASKQNMVAGRPLSSLARRASEVVWAGPAGDRPGPQVNVELGLGATARSW